MAAWLTYAVVVSALVSVAAWLAEQGVRAQRWPARWVWAGALMVSVVAPLAAWLLPAAPAETPLVGVPGAYVLESLPALTAAPASPAGPSLETLILPGWLSVSGLLLVALCALAARLALRLRRWPARWVDGVEVRVSRDMGPAAMGVLRGRVVVPEWALALESRQRRLLVLHESEHVRARDPQLALAGLVVCVLAPWNLPLWWQLRRLRLAIEMDCDARVLRRSPQPRAYGSLLVAVGRRKAHLALALAESRSMLERRIRMMTNRTMKRATLRAVGLAALSAVVLAVACETPGPTGPADVAQRPLEIEETQAAVAAMECEPAIYVNGTRSTLDGVEPVDVATINVFKGPEAEKVRADGEECGVIVVLMKDASVEEADASRRLVERLTRAYRERVGAEARRQAVTLESVEEAPTFTPMTVRPQLRNATEVRAALDELYPPLLRDAGIGGTVNVWFLIDREGAVRRTLINEPSGHDALDAAALAVAERMEFAPAYNRDERVPVWVALDITFEPDAGAGAGAAAAARSQPTEQERRVRREVAEELAVEAAARVRAVEDRRAQERRVQRQDPAAVADPPPFTPMTERPELRDGARLGELVRRFYPRLLRDAGIGGTVSVWFFIDETGRVADARVNETSGYEALDQAALEVARRLEFEPARNQGERVPVWVAIDVMFEVQ